MFSVDAGVDLLSTVPAHAFKPPHSITTPSEALRSQNEINALPRPASYTHLPGVQESQPSSGIKRTFSDNVLALSPDGSPKAGRSPYMPSKALLRNASKRGKGQITVTKFTLSAEDLESTTVHDTERQAPVGSAEKPKTSTGRLVSSTFRNLARRPWRTSSSRSPSPSPKEARRLSKSRNVSPTTKQSISILSVPVNASQSPISRPCSQASDVEDLALPGSAHTEHLPLQRPPSPHKPSRRPLSAILHMNKSEAELGLSKKPSLQSLRSRKSSDKLSSSPLMKVPPIPSSFSSDRLSSVSVDSNKRKDPLWGVFRILEADFQK